MLLEYVASGTNFTHLPPVASKLIDDAAILAEVDIATRRLHAHSHKFSALYNAHIEKTNGRKLSKYPEGMLHQIYADSGGLQVVTLGMEITDDFKLEVYRNQAESAHRGMSFDEIPLQFSGSKSTRLDLSNRWFDRDNFEAMARKTGQNVEEQINVFRELGSKCKPVVIIQGNDYDTYMKWAELCYDEISDDNKPFIGGVAMGAAALGHGPLEDIQRAFYYKQLPIDVPNNHMHLLAVGSVKRLIPNIVFINNGYYGDIHLSYDSTTHTSGCYNGRYFNSAGKYVQVSRAMSKTYIDILADIQTNYPEYMVSLEDFHEAVNSSQNKSNDKYGDTGMSHFRALMYWLYSSVHNFTREVDGVLNNPATMSKFLDRRERIPYNSLVQVTSLDDFRHWERTFRKVIASNPVQSEKPFSLEEFMVA